MIKRYAKVGLPFDMADPAPHVKSVMGGLQVEDLEAEDRNPNTVSRRYFLVVTSHMAAVCYYLVEDLESTREWASRTLDMVDDYFFGAWRDKIPSGNYRDQPPNRAWQDQNRSWDSEFRAAILWGSCLGQWDRLKRFGAYLRDDVSQCAEQSMENRAWYLVVAGVLRDRPWEELQPFADHIRTGRRKREQALLTFLDAILHGTDDQLVVASRDYYRRYKRTEAKLPEIDERLAMDGSFLLHLGEHLGRTVPVPTNVEDHIVRL